MEDLRADQFADFSSAVHGTEEDPRHAFLWQKRLAKEILEDHSGWPEVIRIPTGCGKTSVLDLAVFELAMQGKENPEARTAPMRICFVIDRRLVVDEVADHARRIQRALRDAIGDSTANPVLQTVTRRLQGLSGSTDGPLRLVRLRGGVYRDDGWAADPLTPTIIVSTVDQIGSRLLFRGYGVSRRSRPVHAGLLAFDTRIILDEAHLSSVFADTVGRVARYQMLAPSSPLPEERLLKIVHMSATAAPGSAKSFELKPEERGDTRLRPRLEASKPAELIEVKVEAVTKTLKEKNPTQARAQERENRERLGKEIADAARQLAAEDPGDFSAPRVIGVVVNRVQTARQVFELLRGDQDEGSESDALLLTGRIRPFDRDRLLEEWLPRIRAGRAQEPTGAVFVVATQTVEVGANLDFDALVTEAAPLDALRQRFGRLDRLGRRHQRGVATPAKILIRKDQTRTSDDDPIYGSAIAETWKGLKKLASTTGKGSKKQTFVDFGSNSLDEALATKVIDVEPMLAPTAETPVLFPAHLDAWVQTNPVPDPDPDVAPFIHGRADTAPDIQVVWRGDLDEEDSGRWAEIVRLMPPLTREALPVPIYEVQAWLREEASTGVADVEGARAERSERERSDGRVALRWRGKDESSVIRPGWLNPGDTIVVPASYGGAGAFGWDPTSSTAVGDVAEQCLTSLVASYPSTAYRPPKLRFRLHRRLVPEADPAVRERLERLVTAAVSATRTEGHDPWPPVARALEAWKSVLAENDDRRAAIDALLHENVRNVLPYPGNEGVVVVASARVTLAEAQPSDELEHMEPSGDRTSFTESRVTLARHTVDVRELARQQAVACGLRNELVETIEAAGRWHDEGKRDPRFQAWLHGSEIEALAADEPLAKSGRDLSEWGDSSVFGYPSGARHEFVSTRLFEAAGAPAGASGDGDLAKVLIGTHHGYGRAFAPDLDDPDPIDVRMKVDGASIVASSDHRWYHLDSDWTDLFWRVVRRYGWWGLAYLEALLITADRQVSAQERRERADETGAAP